MKKYTHIFIIALVFLPSVALAQFTGVADLIRATGGIISSLIVVLVALALAAFIWGLVKFIFRVGGDEHAVEEGKRIMIWGLIALFVMVSVWGIINFIQEELDLDNSPPPTPSGGSSLNPGVGT